jgi:hypothetical protein
MALDKTVRFLRFKKPRRKFRGVVTSGASGTTLKCDGAGFDMGYVSVGDYVINTSSITRAAARIESIDDANTLTLDSTTPAFNQVFYIFEPFVPRVTTSSKLVYQKAFLTSSADGTALSYLEVSGQDFLTSVKVGDKVYNTTDDNIQTVLVVVNNTQLFLDGGGVDASKTVHIFRETKEHQYAYVNISDLDATTYNRPATTEFNFRYPATGAGSPASTGRDTMNLFLLPQGGSADDVESQFSSLRERAMNEGSWDRVYYNVDPSEAPDFVVHECGVSAS